MWVTLLLYNFQYPLHLSFFHHHSTTLQSIIVTNDPCRYSVIHFVTQRNWWSA
jgi:hypothetical protein